MNRAHCDACGHVIPPKTLRYQTEFPCPACGTPLSHRHFSPSELLLAALLPIFIVGGAAFGALIPLLFHSDPRDLKYNASLGGFIGLILGLLAWVAVFATLHPYLVQLKVLAPACPHCGYDLRANTTHTCPECGCDLHAKKLQHGSQHRSILALQKLMQRHSPRQPK